MIRALISSVVEGAIKRFSAAGRPGEQFDDREYLQHYGFTSRPLPGAEGVLICDGNHVVMVASDDRRYRIQMVDGEVALYTDEGDKIHLKRGRIIEIDGGEQVVVNTKVAQVTASTSATVTSPVINLGGDRADLLALIDERVIALFNSHTHNGVQAGGANSGGPNTQLTLANCATSVTKAK